MLEARDRLPGRGNGAIQLGFGIRVPAEPRDRFMVGRNRDMTSGFGIYQGFYTMPSNTHVHHLYRPPSNKENIPPESSSSRRRRTRPRKSPLPSWYPRTPLRDITAIVNALERRRARLRASAELRRRNQENANSSPSPFLTSPLEQDLNDSEQPQPPIQDQKSPLNLSDLSPDPLSMIKGSPHPTEHPLTENSPSTENLVTHDEKKIAAVDKMFSDSIDEIEKIVMKKFPMVEKKTMKKSDRRNLMSMR